jgi:hypothetical protein
MNPKIEVKPSDNHQNDLLNPPNFVDLVAFPIAVVFWFHNGLKLRTFFVVSISIPEYHFNSTRLNQGR